MESDKPSIQAFERAVLRLEEGIMRYERDVSDTQIRDGLIQRFEFTYEIGAKALRRYLEYASSTPGDIDQTRFQDVIRSGNEQGLLLGDWKDWRHYRDMRSKTSHTYDEEVALEVVADIPAFLREARYLCDQLRGRLA